MLVVGIDPASVKCGYALLVVDGHADPQYIECGTIAAPANDNKWARMAHIANSVRDVLNEHHVGRGDKVGIESAYVPRDRFFGVETLAEARGAIVYVCVAAAALVLTVAPASVKKAVTGSGKANKEQVAEILRRRFRLRNMPEENAADALGVALAVAQGAGR